jgi:hypothetical protein
MDIKEIGWGGFDCPHLVQNRDQWLTPVYMTLNIWLP